MTSDECIKEFLKYAEEKQFEFHRSLMLSNDSKKDPRIIMRITSFKDYLCHYSDEFFHMEVSFPTDSDSFLADDMISFISKPLDRKQIIRMIKYFMK